MHTRKYNYELLRILAVVAVITIHVSGSYLEAITLDSWLNDFYTERVFVSSLFNALGRFAVPCFIMLSGTFVLDNEKNANCRYYYRKVFQNIGIPTINFSILYFMYSISRKLLAVVIKGKAATELIDVVKKAIQGSPFYHMWYLYMMIGVFLLVPFVIKFKKDVGEEAFKKITIIFFVIAMAGLWTSIHKLQWDPGYSFCYMSYFMMGYIIRKSFKPEKGNLKSIFLIIIGFSVLIGAAYLRYVQGLNGVSDHELNYTLMAPYSPLPTIASVLIFAGFSKLNFRRDITKLSLLAFEIFFIHAVIWDILQRFVTKEMDNRIIIPLMIIVVFVVSLIASIIYKKIWKFIDERWSLSDKFCKLVKL